MNEDDLGRKIGFFIPEIPSEVIVSDELEFRLDAMSEESQVEVLALIELLKEFGLDVISVLDRHYRHVIWQRDESGKTIWMAFRIYSGLDRINILAKAENGGSLILF